MQILDAGLCLVFLKRSISTDISVCQLQCMYVAQHCTKLFRPIYNKEMMSMARRELYKTDKLIVRALLRKRNKHSKKKKGGHKRLVN